MESKYERIPYDRNYLHNLREISIERPLDKLYFKVLDPKKIKCPRNKILKLGYKMEHKRSWVRGPSFVRLSVP